MSSPPPETPGLRERKKAKTRMRIQQEALRLFGEQGYDATTVDQIAAAAEVSPSTFFRYYPAKEDVVVLDEFDPMLEALFTGPDDGREPLASLRTLLTSMIEREGTPNPQLERVRLALAVPALRARMTEHLGFTAGAITRNLAERLSREENDLEVQVFVGALLGALTAAIMRWADGGGRDDLGKLLDQALAHLEKGVPLRQADARRARAARSS